MLNAISVPGPLLKPEYTCLCWLWACHFSSCHYISPAGLTIHIMSLHERLSEAWNWRKPEFGSSYSKSSFVITVSKETVSFIAEKNGCCRWALLPGADQTLQGSLWELWEVLDFSTKAAGVWVHFHNLGQIWHWEAINKVRSHGGEWRSQLMLITLYGHSGLVAPINWKC